MDACHYPRQTHPGLVLYHHTTPSETAQKNSSFHSFPTGTTPAQPPELPFPKHPNPPSSEGPLPSCPTQCLHMNTHSPPHPLGQGKAIAGTAERFCKGNQKPNTPSQSLHKALGTALHFSPEKK